jgi:hypothetical protein
MEVFLLNQGVKLPLIILLNNPLDLVLLPYL